MRTPKDRILQRIVEKIKLSSQNGCKEILIEDLDTQFRDMPQILGLNHEERYKFIKSRLYSARRKTQNLGISILRLWRGREIRGLKPVDINDEYDLARLEGDLDIDRKKRDGFISALDDRVEVAQVAGALTNRQVKRYQLIGGERKKIKLLRK